MTQEEKQILFRDLCTRIPYHTLVQLNPGAYNKPETRLLTGVDGEEIYLNVDSDPFRIGHIKPYLRPMSSMTEEEENKYNSLNAYEKGIFPHTEEAFDWLLANHFDFRGLIEKSLALKAPENMYEKK